MWTLKKKRSEIYYTLKTAIRTILLQIVSESYH